MYSWQNNGLKLAATAVLASSISIAGIAHAEIPQTLSYQGFLVGSDSKPLTGPHNIEFCLYDAITAGNQLWCETQNLTVDTGSFSAELGSVEILAPLPFNIAYYLGVAVDADAEMSPRQVLSAAPYAMSARTLDTTMAVDIECDTGDSINEALQAGASIITIIGICDEVVRVERDDIVLQGGAGLGPHGIVSTTPNMDALVFDGAVRAEVTNLTITGTNRGIGIIQSSVWVRDTTVKNSGGVGIESRWNSNLWLENSTINNNGRGLRSSKSGAIYVNNSVVTANANRGIDINQGSVVLIENGSLISGNTSHGIKVNGNSHLYLAGSTVENNTARGVSVSGSSKADIENTSILTNGDVGVSVYGSSSAWLSNNQINSNATGVSVSQSSNAQFSGNTLNNNTDGGVNAGSSSSLDFEGGNTLSNNGANAVWLGRNSSITQPASIGTADTLIGNATDCVMAITENSSARLRMFNISGNGGGGLCVAQSSVARIYGSGVTISETTANAMRISSLSYVRFSFDPGDIPTINSSEIDDIWCSTASRISTTLVGTSTFNNCAVD